MCENWGGNQGVGQKVRETTCTASALLYLIREVWEVGELKVDKKNQKEHGGRGNERKWI